MQHSYSHTPEVDKTSAGAHDKTAIQGNSVSLVTRGGENKKRTSYSVILLKISTKKWRKHGKMLHAQEYMVTFLFVSSRHPI